MMTTEPSPMRETKRPTRLPGVGSLGRILALAGGSVLGLTLATVALAALVGGKPAAYGALVGAALALGVFVSGTVVVQVVARLVPAAALLVGLMTFTLQVLLMGLVFWRLSRSGLLEDGTLDRAWLAVALILGTVVWSVGQILAVTKARQPLYDLPEAGAR